MIRPVKPSAAAAAWVLAALLAGCASAPPRQSVAPIAWPDDSPRLQLEVLNRVTWGASRSSFQRIRALGTGAFLARELHPDPAA
ncbi:MAG TPA: hypothetical protein VFI86_04720, partial [Burkholderiales bacterium]|nr:hypothetical protein [Burkholderiales bacterium]